MSTSFEFETGALLRLTSVSDPSLSLSVLVEKVGAKSFAFAPCSLPFHRFHLSAQTGILSLQKCGSVGAKASTLFSFVPSFSSESVKGQGQGVEGFILRSETAANRWLKLEPGTGSDGESARLAPQQARASIEEEEGGAGSADSVMSVQVVADSPPPFTLVAPQEAAASSASPQQQQQQLLLPWQIQRFVLEGYLHLPKIADQERVDACNFVINKNLGTPGAVAAGGAQGQGLGKLGGAVSNCNEVRALVSSRVVAAVEGLLGRNALSDVGNLSAQIALRFPEDAHDKKEKLVYGNAWHTDGLRQGKSHPFSLLLGICLSDVETEEQGNLCLWPSTHIIMHQCTCDAFGKLDMDKLNGLLQEQQGEQARAPFIPPFASSSSSIHQRDLDHHDNEPQELPCLGPPHQLLAKAGDIVLLHPDLAHAGGPNLGPHIRSMVYFRLKIKDFCAARHKEDMWNDFGQDVRACARKWLQLPASISSFRPVAATATAALKKSVVHIRDKQMLSRLLYANPVCLLTTRSSAMGEHDNVMTISWLTAVDNRANGFFSLNGKRHTAHILQAMAQQKASGGAGEATATKEEKGREDVEEAPASAAAATAGEGEVMFVLNVACAGMEEALLLVGGSSGGQGDKFDRLRCITRCSVGWSSSHAVEDRRIVGIEQCVAHIVCRVESFEKDPALPNQCQGDAQGHWRVFFSMQCAFVQSDYWDGKVFGPVMQGEDTASLPPPLLSFLGSKRFVKMV